MSDDNTLRVAVQAVRLYAESHPRPTQVTQAQVAEILGVSTRTVRNYISAGKLRLNKCGRVPIEAVDALRAPQ
jgi:excisionase family DNA binding protein